MKNGEVINAKVLKITPYEQLLYQKSDHEYGPVFAITLDRVHSIRYEDGNVEIINNLSPVALQKTHKNSQTKQPQEQAQASPSQRESVTPQANQPQERAQANPPQGEDTTLTITLLQNVLNALPAVSVAGNNLKFQFSGQSWVAQVNGENFSKGNTEFKVTAEGGTLTLRQTHIWPGAVGKTAGRVASKIPGGGVLGNVLNTAGSVAGAAGPIETSGTIVLEYRSGPPASLKLVSNSSK